MNHTTISKYIIIVLLVSCGWLIIFVLRDIKQSKAYNKILIELFDAKDKYIQLLYAYELLANKLRQATRNPISNLTPLDIAYNSFGLSRGASQQEIKNKFRLLVKKYHPDLNKSKEAAVKFKIINEAYVLLKSIK